jgi:hypothetical protein
MALLIPPELAFGLTSNKFSSVVKFGQNTNISTSGEDIASQGGSIPYLTSATTMEIVSSDANDAAAGSGARTVRVYYLDGNWEDQYADVTMNGTNAVEITGDMLRPYRARVTSCGTSGGSNTGTLTIRPSGGGSTYLEIPASVGTTLFGAYTVPAGYEALLVQGTVHSESTKVSDFYLYTRANNLDPSAAPYAAWIQSDSILGVDGSEVWRGLGLGNPIPARTDLRVHCEPAANGTRAHCTFFLQLRKLY